MTHQPSVIGKTFYHETSQFFPSQKEKKKESPKKQGKHKEGMKRHTHLLTPLSLRLLHLQFKSTGKLRVELTFGFENNKYFPLNYKIFLERGFKSIQYEYLLPKKGVG